MILNFHLVGCRSQRQTEPSSQTQMMVDPSRLTPVCRMTAVHFGLERMLNLQESGSDTETSQTYVLPTWNVQKILSISHCKINIQSNLCTTTRKLWPLLTGVRCSEVPLRFKHRKMDLKIVVGEGRWLLFGGGR